MTNEAAKRPWPVELRLNPAKTQLTVEYDTGERFVLPAEYLRVESPSAEVQGHGAGQKLTVPGKSALWPRSRMTSPGFSSVARGPIAAMAPSTTRTAKRGITWPSTSATSDVSSMPAAYQNRAQTAA